jgi:hypothetical protein
MNRIASGAVFFLLFAAIAAAQDEVPKTEILGGYSLTHEAHWNLNGFAAEYEHNLNSHFGVLGDFSYGRKSGKASSTSVSSTFNQFLLMGGPRISFRSDKGRLFIHGLVGGMRLKVKGSTSGYGILYDGPFTNLAMAFGGGFDIPVKGRFSIRPAQMEWMKVRFNKKVSGKLVPYWADQFRYSAGIVVRLGEK